VTRAIVRKRRPKPLKLTDIEPQEDELHKSVAQLLDRALLEPAFWTTFPAGMYVLPRHVGGRLKAYGMKDGVPDIEVIYDGRVVWLELKRPHGSISKAQRAAHPKLERAGCHVYVCRTPEAVIDALDRERFPVRPEIVRQLRRDGPFFRAERQSTGDLYYGQGELQTKSRAAA